MIIFRTESDDERALSAPRRSLPPRPGEHFDSAEILHEARVRHAQAMRELYEVVENGPHAVVF